MQFLKNLGAGGIGMGAAKGAAPAAKPNYFSSLKLEYCMLDIETILQRLKKVVSKTTKTRKADLQKVSFHKNSP
jgi:hypothetical protein